MTTTTASAAAKAAASVTKETDLFGCALKFDCSLTVKSEQQEEKKKTNFSMYKK